MDTCGKAVELSLSQLTIHPQAIHKFKNIVTTKNQVIFALYNHNF